MTDIAIRYLLRKILSNGLDLLGEGVDRMTFSVGENIAIKTPVIVENVLSWSGCSSDSLIKMELDKNLIAIRKEDQTKKEIEIYNMFDCDVVSKYCAKLIKVEKWNNCYITVWEKLSVYEDFPQYFNSFKDDLIDLLQRMKNDDRINHLNIEINDLHKGNFGYDKDMRLKFLDLGYWDILDKNESLKIDYTSATESGFTHEVFLSF